MIPKHRSPTTPGEMLVEEFLKPQGLTQTALAERMGVHVQVVNSIANGRRAVTAEMAWKLGAALKTGPEYWMNLQVACDLYAARPRKAG